MLTHAFCFTLQSCLAAFVYTLLCFNFTHTPPPPPVLSLSSTPPLPNPYSFRVHQLMMLTTMARHRECSLPVGDIADSCSSLTTGTYPLTSGTGGEHTCSTCTTQLTVKVHVHVHVYTGIMLLSHVMDMCSFQDVGVWSSWSVKIRSHLLHLCHHTVGVPDIHLEGVTMCTEYW